MALCYCFLQGSRKLIDWIWMMLSDLHWRLGSYEYFGPFARCCGMIFWDTAGVLRWFSCRVQVIVLFMMLVYSFFFNLLVSQLGGPRGDWRCCCCSFRVVKPPWGVPNIGVPQMDGIYGKIPWKLMMTGGTSHILGNHMCLVPEGGVQVPRCIHWLIISWLLVSNLWNHRQVILQFILFPNGQDNALFSWLFSWWPSFVHYQFPL